MGHFYDEVLRCSDLCSVSYLPGCTPEQVDRYLLRANEALIREYYYRAHLRAVEQAERLYIDRPRDFRGWRQI